MLPDAPPVFKEGNFVDDSRYLGRRESFRIPMKRHYYLDFSWSKPKGKPIEILLDTPAWTDHIFLLIAFVPPLLSEADAVPATMRV